MGETIDVTFSKTRLVYWENKASALVKNSSSTFKVTKPNESDAQPTIAVATIPGSLHNWHYIPENQYGLYMTTNEMYSLYENFDGYYPASCTVVTGHCVPIATFPGSANTTSLSFNNTIYSLIYTLKDTDLVTNGEIFGNNADTAYPFFRTFDGASYNDNKRLTLPIPDILYKFPITLGSKYPEVQPAYKEVIIPVDAGTDFTSAAGPHAQPLSMAAVVEEYIPEFLQDNENVKCLYPGENQNVFNYSNEKNPLAMVFFGSNKFGEYWQDKDARAMGISSNTPFDEKQLLLNSVWPRSRGMTDQLFGGFSVAHGTNTTQDTNKQYYANVGSNLTPADYVVDGPPKEWIKGLPILDGTDNLVNHTFCATITWTLTIKGIPRKPYVPRPLKYGFVVPEATTWQGSATDDATANGIRTSNTFRKKWPQRHQDDHEALSYRLRLRPSYFTADIPALMSNTFPMQMPYSDIELSAEEVEIRHYARNNIASLPSATFSRTEPPVTRSQTKKKR